MSPTATFGVKPGGTTHGIDTGGVPAATVSGERRVTLPRTSISPADPTCGPTGAVATVIAPASREPSSSISTSIFTVSPALGASFAEATARWPFGAFKVTSSMLPPALTIACRLPKRTIVPRTTARLAWPLSEMPSATGSRPGRLE